MKTFWGHRPAGDILVLGIHKYNIAQKEVLYSVYYTKSIYVFYPTALKDCQGIVFTYGVRMGGQVAGKVCPGRISETVRCKLILGREIG